MYRYNINTHNIIMVCNIRILNSTNMGEGNKKKKQKIMVLHSIEARR